MSAFATFRDKTFKALNSLSYEKHTPALCTLICSQC